MSILSKRVLGKHPNFDTLTKAQHAARELAGEVEILEAIRRKMPKQKPGTSKQDYETPLDFIKAVEKYVVRGKFACDLAATSLNTKARMFLGPGSLFSKDSFTADWADLLGGKWGWLNPPFKRIGPWAQKCRDEASKGAKICMLVPAATSTNWFSLHVHKRAQVFAISPRLSFDGKGAFPKDLMLVVYGWDQIGFDTWRWDGKAEK